MALSSAEYTGGATGWAGAGAYHGTDYAMVVISSNLAIDQAHTILWISAPGQGEYTSPKTIPPLYNNAIGAHYKSGDLPETRTVGGVVFKFIYIICEYNQYTDAAPITNFYLNVLLPTLGLTYNPNGCVGSGLSLGGSLVQYWNDGTYPIPTIALLSFCSFDGVLFSITANTANTKNNIKSLRLVHNPGDPTVAYSVSTNARDAMLAAYPSYDVVMSDGVNVGQHDSWTLGYTTTNSAADSTTGYDLYLHQATKFSQLANLAVSAFTPPTVTVSGSQSITLPASTVSLTCQGTATQAGATILSYEWRRTSGPSAGTISSPSSQNTTITNLAAGNYVFNVLVQDSNNQTVTGTVSVTVNAAVVSAPVAIIAGGSVTINPPPYTYALDGSGSTAPGSTITSYAWSQISGPTGATIISPSLSITQVNNLILGSYVWQLTITSGSGGSSSASITLTVATGTPIVNPDTSTTANQSIPVYSNKFLYGSNLGYYPGAGGVVGFTNIQLTQIGATLGIKSIRVTINDNYLTPNGLTSLVPDHIGFAAAGYQDTAAIVGNANSTNCEVDANGNRVTYLGCSAPSNMFNGIYLPIWNNQATKVINPLNLAANFFYNAITTYGPYVKFWEVENEPDFTYSTYNAFAGPGIPGNWYTAPPPASSLPNLNCPPNYYIRELRIFYEILKSLYPNSYVCTGGLGYPSYLDFILRSSDHPTDGTQRTTAYPYGGGAWFDCLSFHSYPFYTGGRYYTPAGFIYYNDSDAFANQLVIEFQQWQSTLNQYGYDGINFPRKKMILTEHNIPSQPISANGNVGGLEIEADYLIKAHILLQKAGLAQAYVYNLGNVNDYPAATGANPFDYMGFFDNLRKSSFGNQTVTAQGYANYTTTMILDGYKYNAGKTSALQLPTTVNGAAFTNAAGNTRYCLWAIAQDPGTIAGSAFDCGYVEYALPGATGNATIVYRDYTKTGYSKVVPVGVIPLVSVPIFIMLAGDTIPTINPSCGVSALLTPVVQPAIYIELPNQAIYLSGSLSTSPTGQIASWTWAKVSGPTGDTIIDPNAPQTVVKCTQAGTYVYSLTITN